jgi:two-component system CheB/CheR fusion protein
MHRVDGSVCIVDDDADLGASLSRLLQRHGYSAQAFTDPAAFLATHGNAEPCCIITDIMMGEISGFDLAQELRKKHSAAAIIFMTAWPRSSDAVTAIRDLGGLDYLEKPLDMERLLHAVGQGLAWSRNNHSALKRLALLSPRERQAFNLMAKGKSSKVIAAELGVAIKTVEAHRAAVMKKTAAGTIADLIDIARQIDGVADRYVQLSANGK